MAYAIDPAELRDVGVDQFAWLLAFIARDGRPGVKGLPNGPARAGTAGRQ